jgi:adenylosuccinate synthase
VRLADHITSTHSHIQRELLKNVPILLEGAQGALLDVDHGTYPYVTSSPPGAAGGCQGAGIGPTSITSVIGVLKAYMSRVGNGPFPTELDEESDEAQRMRQIGKPWQEVGTTTGRNRRVGWFDAIMGRYAVEINGIDTVAITKLDVLDTFERIKICVAYRLGDELIYYPPTTAANLNKVEPVYEEIAGWQRPTSHIRTFHELPTHAQAYVARICELLGARLGLITVGPEREQTITVDDIF